MKYVLKHVCIFDGYEDHELMSDRNLYLNDEKIEFIEAGDQKIRDGYQVIDLTGKYVMPGLINLHVHLFGTGKPSSIMGGGILQKGVINFCQTKLGRKVLDKILAENLANQVKSGVTTVRAVGDFFYSDVDIRDQINDNKILGPRLFVSGPAITVPGGHGDGTFARSAASLSELKKLVKDNHDHHVDLIKICVTGGVMDALVKGEPGVVKMNLAQTKAVCDQAHELGYLVASHTESSAGIKIALAGGVDTIEHGSVLDDELLAAFKKSSSSFICTLSPALPLATFSPKETKLNDLALYNSKVVLDNMIQGTKTALANQLQVGLGTDSSCPFVTQYDMWREVAYFVKYIGVSNQFALATATLHNARILKIDHDTGSIEAGKMADLLVLDDNPLKNLETLSKLKMVFIKGRMINEPVIKKNKQIEKLLDTLL